VTKGTIRHLIRDRGYGFIQTEEWPDLFFHTNDLQGVAFESLTEGQQLEFEIMPTSKGPKAVNVSLAER
jgi:CspA family cold shock protein